MEWNADLALVQLGHLDPRCSSTGQYGDGTFGSPNYQDHGDPPVDVVLGRLPPIRAPRCGPGDRGNPFIGLSVFRAGVRVARRLRDARAQRRDGLRRGPGDFNGDGLPDIVVGLGDLDGGGGDPVAFHAPFLAGSRDLPACRPYPRAAGGLQRWAGPQQPGSLHHHLQERHQRRRLSAVRRMDRRIGVVRHRRRGLRRLLRDEHQLRADRTRPGVDSATPTIQSMSSRSSPTGAFPRRCCSTMAARAPSSSTWSTSLNGTTISGTGIGTQLPELRRLPQRGRPRHPRRLPTRSCRPAIPYSPYYQEISASHELAEASSDPLVQTAPAYTSSSFNNGWVGEIGDLCTPVRHRLPGRWWHLLRRPTHLVEQRRGRRDPAVHSGT